MPEGSARHTSPLPSTVVLISRKADLVEACARGAAVLREGRARGSAVGALALIDGGGSLRRRGPPPPDRPAVGKVADRSERERSATLPTRPRVTGEGPGCRAFQPASMVEALGLVSGRATRKR